MVIYPKYSFWWVTLKGVGWLYMIPMIFGTAVLIAALTFSLSAFRLETQGRDAPGVVTSLDEDTHRCGKKGRSTCTNHWVSYRFTTASEEVRLDREAVSLDLFQRLRVGASLTVRYVPGQPDINEIEPGEMRSESWTMVLIASGIWGGLAVFGSRHLRDCRRGLWLRDAGTLRRTLVTEVKDAKIKINGFPLYRIVWAGPPGEGWAHWKSNLPEVGNEVFVYDHPGGQWASVWEGDVGSRNNQRPGRHEI
ncbi:Protein of unknown function DUF3592 [Paracoccaceae bacterium]|jgi:hypothetical protein